MLVLKALALEPIHGYGVVVRIEQISRGVFSVSAGSMFVAFPRLHRAGLIKSDDRSRPGPSHSLRNPTPESPTAPHVGVVNALVQEI